MRVNRRPRVLLYVPLLQVGGTERRVERLATLLDRARFDCAVAWSDGWGPIGDRLTMAGVTVARIPLNAAPSRPDAVRRIRDIDPDIFHSFSYRRDSFDVLAAQAAEVPFIVTSRVNARWWDQQRTVREWELERNRGTHWITAVSDAAASLCETVEGFPRRRITVIHNGVAIADQDARSRALCRELNLPEATPLVGCVGNYRADKGHALLLEAFRRVLDRHPDAHLVCCGLDVQRIQAGLGELAAALRIQRSVSLLGSRADVATVYRALDVYVQPSLSEGFSNALLEAMAHGLPAVATAVGGTPEAVVDGVTGLLVPAGDSRELARAIASLLEDRSRRVAMGRAAYDRCKERFSVATMVGAYARLYEELRPSPPRARGRVPRSQRSPDSRGNGRRVRVLFHADYLWSGGLEKKVAHLALGLDSSRFEPIVSWSRKWGNEGRRIAEAGIPVMRINPQGESDAVADQIRDIEPDIFHSFSCTRHSADVLAAQAAGVPVIMTNRGNMRSWDADQAVQSWEIERNRITDKVVACSDAVAAVSAAVEGLAASDVAVIRNGVALPDGSVTGTGIREELRLPADAPVIGYAATYRTLKGHEVLLRAFRQIVDRLPSAHLICCGEEYDDTKTRIQHLVRDLDLDRNVSLLAAREDVSAIYRGLSLYVHPSLSEGSSNSILEAMAHGLAVVATSVGGTPEAVVEGATGLLVPPGNHESLAHAVRTLLDDPPRRRQLGEAGFERAKAHFPVGAMVRAYEDLYVEALTRRLQNEAKRVALIVE